MCAYKVLLISRCRNQQGGKSRCILDRVHGLLLKSPSLNFRPFFASFEFPGESVGSIILERITKKRTKNKAKTTKLDSEWKRL
ncbi:hypothetical protein Tco_0545100 [Tanacetum coccineum]